LGEEGYYLSGTCCDKDFAQRVEAESEQRASAAAMIFDRNGMQARHGDAVLLLAAPTTLLLVS